MATATASPDGVFEVIRGTMSSTAPKKLVDLSVTQPKIATLLTAVLIQNTTPEVGVLLRDGMVESAKVKGRSAAAKKDEPTEKEGEDVYDRPNGDKYYARMWGEHRDVVVLQKARAASMFPLLYGAPGCGKTALVEAAFGSDLYTVLGTGDTETSDFIGQYVQTPDGGFLWVDGPLIKAAEEGKPLLIDEVGLIDPKVMSLVYSLMDGRRELPVTANPERGTVKAAAGFFIIAATNPNAPGVRLSEALLSRFPLQAEMTTDWNLARKLGVSTAMVGAAQNLAKRVASGDISWAPQFRELLAYRDCAKLFGQTFAIQNLIAGSPEVDRDEVTKVFSKAFANEFVPATI